MGETFQKSASCFAGHPTVRCPALGSGQSGCLREHDSRLPGYWTDICRRGQYVLSVSFTSDCFTLTLQLIDGEAFLLLNQQDIVKVLNVKLGPAVKIYNAVVLLRDAIEL